jgi:DNA-binding CsgD family transcriptional regulator
MRAEDHANPEAAEFDRFAHDGNEIPLARTMLETGMVRSRAAAIVVDAETDPRTYKPLVRVTQSRSYVAAPITTNRRVIGFLHADRLGQDSEVTTGDLQSLEQFSAEFGVLFECAVLTERIDGQRARMSEVLSEVTADLGVLAEAPLSLFPLPAEGQQATLTPQDVEVGASSRDPLSRREHEVLTLLSTGATNRAIAQELVLSTDTVKSHVANVMRKLRVSTRAEAVARYLRLRALEDVRAAP